VAYYNPAAAYVKIKGELVGPAARKFMDLVMNKIEGYVIQNLSGKVLYSRNAGGLKSKVAVEKLAVTGMQVQGKIGIAGGGGKYTMIATIWEFTGHKAFTVYPKHKKALLIPTGKRLTASGKFSGFVLRKHAHIPAEKPRPFIKPAIDQAGPWIRALHEKHYKDVLGAVSYKVDTKG
jgi:hypothetical protein